MGKLINISGRLHSREAGETPSVVTGANEVYDDDKHLRQSEINANVGEAVTSLQTAVETKQQTITQVNVDVNNEVGQPSGTASVEGGTMNLSLQNIKGEKGDKGDTGQKGPQGDSAVYNPDPSLTPVFEIANSLGRSTTKSISQKAVTDEINGLRIDSWESVSMGSRIDGLTTASSEDSSTGYTYKTGNSKFRVIRKQFSQGDILHIERSTADSAGLFIGICASELEPANGVECVLLASTSEVEVDITVTMPFDGWLGIRYYLSTVSYTPTVQKAKMWKDKVEQGIGDAQQQMQNVTQAVQQSVDEIRDSVNSFITNPLATFDSDEIYNWDVGYWIDGNNKYNSSSAKGRLLAISAYRGKTMSLKARTSRTAVYAFLKSKNNWSSGGLPDFVDGTHRVTVAGGTTTEVVVPDTATYLYVEYNKGATSSASNLTYPAEVKFIGTVRDIVEDNASKVAKIYNTPIHVNATSGDDNNNGLAANTAVATIAKALSLSGRDARIILHGDTQEAVTISAKRRVVLTNAPGEIARIIRGVKISEATLDSETGIYSKNIADSAATTFQQHVSQANYWIYQHNVADTSTLIPDNERHPAQRGRVYRCGSTRMTRYTSLQALQNSDTAPAYYYDATNTILYFRIAEGSDLLNNPVILPQYGDRAIYCSNTEVHITGINVLYGSIDIVACHNSSLTDCSAMYVSGGQLGGACGAIMWRSSCNITFTRCEAARCTLGSSSATGDGFNAHNRNDIDFTDREIKYMTATLIDCWGHDNSDEGVSDHGRSEVTYIGGLFEHNGTGAAPALGSSSTFYNVTFRANDTEGLRSGATISQTVEQVGVGTCTIAYNCLSENNGGRGYETSNGKAGRPNTLTLIGCKAVNNTGTGFYSSSASNNPLYLYDCSYSGNATPVANATAIKNTSPVTQ